MRRLKKDGHDDHDVIAVKILLHRNISKKIPFLHIVENDTFLRQFVSWNFDVGEEYIFFDEEVKKAIRSCYLSKKVWFET